MFSTPPPLTRVDHAPSAPLAAHATQARSAELLKVIEVSAESASATATASQAPVAEAAAARQPDAIEAEGRKKVEAHLAMLRQRRERLVSERAKRAKQLSGQS